MEPEDILKEAAIVTAAKAGTDRCVKMVENSLKLCGKAILPYIHRGDESGLFVPLLVKHQGKEQPGCILTLSDRAVLAWITGTFRVKNFEAVIPYSSIEWIEAEAEPASRTSAARDVLRILAEDEWTIILQNIFGDGMNIPAVLHGVLSGSVELRRQSESQQG
jgi:hypothetical protein